MNPTTELLTNLRRYRDDCEANVKYLRGALQEIQNYIDSPDIDIGLTEYSTISILIRTALEDTKPREDFLQELVELEQEMGYEKPEDC